MRTSKELQSLLGLFHACEDAIEACNQLQEYEKKHEMNFDSKERFKVFSGCYIKVSNILTSIKKNTKLFISSPAELESVLRYIAIPVTVPNSMQSSFTSASDLSLEHVLRIARNYLEHPEKNDQLQYFLLADTISQETIFQSLFYAVILVKKEMSCLSQEERRIMFAQSADLYRFVQNAKLQFKKVLPELQKDNRFTPEMRNMIDQFIDYTPSSENVQFDDNLPTRIL